MTSFTPKADFETVQRFLPFPFREHLEAFYKKIDEKATWQSFSHDPEFHANPISHVAMYADHGTVHVRDISVHFLKVFESCQGVLIPPRQGMDLEFIHGIREEPWGQRTMRFYNPDRFIIEVAEPILSTVKRYTDLGLSIDEISKKTQFSREDVKGLLSGQ